MAMNTHRQLGINSGETSKSLEKLSSGLRINRAGDDAAGLAISEKMRGQIRGLNQASRNAQDGISFIQTAEGALNETHDILQRMRELAVQSSNDTNIAVDRNELQKEIDQLAQEITRIANDTEFNQQTLLNGGITDGATGSVKFHIGANEGQNISLEINAMDAKSLGVSRDVNTAKQDAVAGDVSSVTFKDEVGTGVEDGATITLSYTAAVSAQAATAGTSVGDVTYANIAALNSALDDCTGPGNAKTLELTIDGVDKTITFAGDYTAADAFADWDAFKSFVDGQLGGAATIECGDTLAFTVTSGTTGTTSTVTVKTDDDNLMKNVSTVDTDGAAAVAAQSAKVTFTSDGAGAKTQTINVTGNEKTLTLNDGFFKGTTVNLSGKASDIAGGDDTFTIAVETEAATAAQFSGGAKTESAFTKAGIDISTQAAASKAITTINNAIEKVSAERSKLGAYQNRLEHTIKNLDTSSENLQASESRIRDVDMAKEMMAFTKNNILSQAAQAMLAQANQAPQGVLQLLR